MRTEIRVVLCPGEREKKLQEQSEARGSREGSGINYPENRSSVKPPDPWGGFTARGKRVTLNLSRKRQKGRGEAR